MKTDQKSSRIEEYFRLIGALILTIAFHSLFFVFSARDSSTTPKIITKPNSFIIGENVTKFGSFLEIIRCGNPGLFVKPDLNLGFSSVLNKRNAVLSEQQEIELKPFEIAKILRGATESPYRENFRIILPQKPYPLFKGESKIEEQDFPLVFDQYGKFWEELSQKCKGLNFSSAKSPSAVEISQLNQESLPNIALKASSGVAELDNELKKMLGPFVRSLIEKSSEQPILLTIYWKSQFIYDKN